MIFGTDGVRGIVDKDINCKLAYDIGKGYAITLNKLKLNKKIVIGCDTRNSSSLYVSAVACGLSDYGIDVDVVGIVSTPMISYLVLKNDYSGGVMITASHNDSRFNGIKIFNELGEKTNKEYEDRIIKNVNQDIVINNKGHINYIESISEQYYNNLVNTFDIDLKDFTIVIDSAHGSNYKFAPKIFKRLGANVIPIGSKPSGYNINENCGAQYIDNLISEVKLHNADLGIAFDGDGDRLRVVLNDGRVLSGEDLLLIFALYFKRKNNLNKLTVAGTILTNIGLDDVLKQNNIKIFKSDVGDKNLIELLKISTLKVGAEPSGHICILDYLPTCDALYNSLVFIKCFKEFGDEIYDIIDSLIMYPTISKNIEVDEDFRNEFVNNSSIQKQINKIKTKYCDEKIIVRLSGTEPVIRVHIEGKNIIKNEDILNEIKNILKK